MNDNISIIYSSVLNQTKLPPKDIPIKWWINVFDSIVISGMPYNSARARRADLESFLNFCTKKEPEMAISAWIRSVTITYLRQYYKQPSISQRRLSALRLLYNFISKHSLESFILGNPTERIRWAKAPTPNWKGLTKEEVARLISTAEDHVYYHEGRAKRAKPSKAHRQAIRNYAIIRVLLGCGLRVGELCQIDINQFVEKKLKSDPSAYFMNVLRKGGDLQNIYIPAKARRAITHYIELRGLEAGALFLSSRNKRLTQNAIWYMLQNIAKDAKEPAIEIYPHILRHTALRQIARTSSIETAKRLAGHKNIKITERYTCADDLEVENAQEKAFSD